MLVRFSVHAQCNAFRPSDPIASISILLAMADKISSTLSEWMREVNSQIERVNGCIASTREHTGFRSEGEMISDLSISPCHLLPDNTMHTK